jgi:hypothetical protein
MNFYALWKNELKILQNCCMLIVSVNWKELPEHKACCFKRTAFKEF